MRLSSLSYAYAAWLIQCRGISILRSARSANASLVSCIHARLSGLRFTGDGTFAQVKRAVCHVSLFTFDNAKACTRRNGRRTITKTSPSKSSGRRSSKAKNNSFSMFVMLSSLAWLLASADEGNEQELEVLSGLSHPNICKSCFVGSAASC